MELLESTKHLTREALTSHEYCTHDDIHLCQFLILTEIGLRRGHPVDTDAEIEAILTFIADAVLESLVLKGVMEPVGINPDGQFLYGLAEHMQDGE